MSNEEWTEAIGLRRAALSLVWRTVVAALAWAALLWTFFFVLNAIGVTSVPLLVAIGLAVPAGIMTGFIMSRGLDEVAGFVSPLLTILTLAFAAVAIVGAEALFHRAIPTGTDHLRYIIVGTTMIVATAWIVRYTLFEVG